MESNDTRWIAYLLLLAAFLFFFYALDKFFGLHYEPDEHRANQPEEGISVEESGESFIETQEVFTMG